MEPEYTKIHQEFAQYWKYNKTPLISYNDLKSLIEKVDGCKNNLENSSAIKGGEYIPSGFLIT